MCFCERHIRVQAEEGGGWGGGGWVKEGWDGSGQSPVFTRAAELSGSQFFHVFFLTGSWPVLSKYLWTSASCVAGRQGWYLL